MKIQILFLLLVFVTSSSVGQQVPDTKFSPIMGETAYPPDSGPVILVDEAHHNFHTIDNRFKPFFLLLTRDGYRVKAGTVPFSKTALDGVAILVVSNALNKDNVEDWSLPNASAFSDEEIAAVQSWVTEGGSLFLLADHMPFPGCNEKLAAAFGFKFYNGFAMDTTRKDGPDLFSINNKRLAMNPITAGLDSIYSFTGQAFDIPPQATALLTLDQDFKIWLPRVAWQFKKETVKIAGNQKVQLATLEYGKGRVVIGGEAAMFTAQLAGKKKKDKIGFNNPLAKRNAEFLLRIIHWLDNR
jgi:hypothetical protein